jgi:glycosyltransferase involved in cell wall biosynthesis
VTSLSLTRPSRSRVFYVNVDFPPMSGPGVWRALGFAKYLPRHGHDVYVLCADLGAHWPRHDTSLLAQLPPEVTVWRQRSLLLHDLRVALWYKGNRARGERARRAWAAVDRLLLRFYPEPYAAWVLRAVAHALKEAGRVRPRCVITSGPPHVSHVVGLVLQSWLRIPWIADIRDPWIEDAVHLQPGPYQEGLFRWVERRVLKRADAVLTISPRLFLHFKERVRQAGGDAARVHLVENGHDVAEQPAEVSRFPPAHGRLHVHFNGTLQAASRCHTLLDALALLRADGVPPSGMPVVTLPGGDEAYAQEASARDLSGVMLDVGAQSHAESLRFSAAADVLLAIAVDRQALSVGVTPAKVYESMALGRPILALVPRESDVVEMLRSYPRAFCADVSDARAIRDALRQLMDLGARGALTEPGPLGEPEKFSRRARAGELAAIIAALPRRAQPRARRAVSPVNANTKAWSDAR